MEAVLAGIPLDRVTTSFTINGTAPILLAMYQAVAAKQGVRAEKIAGTIQNDLLKEFGSRGAWIFPIEPSMRLAVDAIEYSDRIPAALQPDLHRLRPLPRRRRNPARGDGLHAGRRPSPTCAPPGARHLAARPPSRLPLPSSATRIPTSSRRSPSTAPGGASWARPMRDASARNPDSGRLPAPPACAAAIR